MIRNMLAQDTWPDATTSSADEFYDHLCASVLELQENHIPSKILKGPRKHKPYQLSQHDLKAIKKKHRCWTRYIETKSTDKYKEYVRARNKVNKIIRQAQKKLENKICNDIDKNPKLFWKYIQSKTAIKERIPDLKHGNTVADTEELKSEALSDFFVSVFTKEPDTDLPTVELPGHFPQMPEINVTPDMVYQKLKNLDPAKSVGPDQLHPRVLKEAAQELRTPLSYFYQATLQTGRIPKIWKTATISAIFKKGDKSLPSNYRPISLTCILCKVLESIIRDHIIDHMNTHNLFSSKQFGFISGRSTTLQLLHVVEKITSYIDNGHDTSITYLDFQKAFDSVPHKRLLQKLDAYRLEPQAITWIKDFLTDRSQTVVVNGVHSKSQHVTSGVPQGSVLGPTLFTLFINELPNITSSLLYLFADDAKLLRPIVNPSDFDHIQNDINDLHNWTQSWLLKFNESKCKTMHIGKRQQPQTPTFPNNPNPLTLTEEEKDLGVLFDDALTFRSHISAQTKKATKILGIIRRSFINITPQNFKKLYTSLVRPHLEYGSSVWHPHLKRDITAIEKIQRKGTKFIPSLRHLPYPDRLRQLHLPSLTHRRLRGDLIEAFKIFSHYSTDPSEILHLHVPTQSTTTRGHHLKLQKDRNKTTIRNNTFSQRIVNNWNSLPQHIISAPSINVLKNHLYKNT